MNTMLDDRIAETAYSLLQQVGALPAMLPAA